MSIAPDERFPLMKLNFEEGRRYDEPECQVEPHPYARMSRWRFWLCKHCFAPRKLHPRKEWVRARPLGDYSRYVAKDYHLMRGW